MKKLLLLGGLRFLIPVIEKAKALGHYVITCDYLPENIAHQYSDEYHNVDITDKAAVLQLAEELNIDGIMSFAVDPGVLTAAYVSEKLGLSAPGPYESIQILQNKGLFRKFLNEHGFNVPFSKVYSDLDKAIAEFSQKELPVIVKPVDSAGSKGVTKVTSISDITRAINVALNASPSQTFIIEEFLESQGYSSDSDCFSINGEFKFMSFSNQLFDDKSPNPYAPSAYSWPSTIRSDTQRYLESELQRLINLLEMRSSIYNIEVREATNGKAYIMEVSPRGGGNRISEMLEVATDTDLISDAIRVALGEDINLMSEPIYSGYWAEVILYSMRSGMFKEVKINKIIKDNLVKMDLWVDKGQYINAFTGANEAVGTLVLNFSSKEDLDMTLSKYSELITVVTEKEA